MGRRLFFFPCFGQGQAGAPHCNRQDQYAALNRPVQLGPVRHSLPRHSVHAFLHPSSPHKRPCHGTCRRLTAQERLQAFGSPGRARTTAQLDQKMPPVPE